MARDNTSWMRKLVEKQRIEASHLYLSKKSKTAGDSSNLTLAPQIHIVPEVPSHSADTGLPPMPSSPTFDGL